jgi:tetratricopeptide (TPR) repeat protein
MRGLTFMLCLLLGTVLITSAQSRPDTVQFQILFDSLQRVSNRWTDNERLLQLAGEVLKQSRQLGRWKEEVEAGSVMGIAFTREDRFAEAEVFLTQSLNLSQKHGDTAMAGSMLLNLASLKMDQDSHLIATAYVQDALSKFVAIRDTKQLAFSYSFMAGLLSQIGHTADATEYSALAFNTYPNGLNDPYGLKLASNHASNLQKLGKLDSALVWLARIAPEAEKQSDRRIQIQIRSLYSHIYLKKGEYEKCIASARSALEWESEMSRSFFYAESYTNLGVALLETGKPKEALEALNKAWGHCINQRASSKVIVLRNLHRAQAKNGLFKEAYTTMTEYSALMDTLRKQDNLKVINELQTRYETEKKERDLRELDQQNRIQALRIRQRNILIIGIILASIALIGGGFMVSRQRIARQRQAAIENRLVSLRMQLNPHFIFNALSAIQNYILSGKDVREATRYLSNFAKVMRAFLEFNQTETISLEKEIEGLELYIGLQKVRFNQAFEHEVIVSDEIDPSDTLVPPMMLQPFVENAIEHGLRGMDQGRLTLSYSIEGQSLVMVVSDNGRGRNKAGSEQQNKAFEKQSLATRITAERIALLNASKREKERYRFEISDLNADGTGTVARFCIPYMHQS